MLVLLNGLHQKKFPLDLFNLASMWEDGNFHIRCTHNNFYLSIATLIVEKEKMKENDIYMLSVKSGMVTR
jgi:hypothetical protein